MAMNTVDTTASRMKNDPDMAATMLVGYPKLLEDAVTLHLTATTGGPSHALKTIIAAWFDSEEE
eukprot:m.72395 g.72395  ORF g.72395 m.72395 type:complete len:64 (+) comp12322_c0_seq2:2676-2867(+)